MSNADRYILCGVIGVMEAPEYCGKPEYGEAEPKPPGVETDPSDGLGE